MDQKRNLNPHKPARMAMVLYNTRYAAHSGGSMDFWGTLFESEKELCRELVLGIETARPEIKEGA